MDKNHKYDKSLHPVCPKCERRFERESLWHHHLSLCTHKVEIRSIESEPARVLPVDQPKPLKPLPNDFFDALPAPSSSQRVHGALDVQTEERELAEADINEKLDEFYKSLDTDKVSRLRSKVCEWKSKPEGNLECSDGIAQPSAQDTWDIDLALLEFSESTYRGNKVAIAVIKQDKLIVDLPEFTREVGIMRKLQHKNLVRFIGACTKVPNLCIVTEFLSWGSVFDFLHKHKIDFKLQYLLKIATDLCKTMIYIHGKNAIHGDLKASNILIDDKNKVIKLAGYGISRLQVRPGVMDSELGIYHWLAPEVTENASHYKKSADVFSFGCLLWELLAGQLPYDAASQLKEQGLRPTIPEKTSPQLAGLLKECWHENPKRRPKFCEILPVLKQISIAVRMISVQLDLFSE